MTYPDVAVVNERDEVIGQAQLEHAIKTGQIVRIARVVLEAADGSVLLQKRSQEVWDPNLWNESAAGHVEAGHTYEQTATTEATEELGVVISGLVLADKYYTENETPHGIRKSFDAMFVGKLDREASVKLGAEEVAAVKWLPFKDIDRDIRDNPQNYTVGFRRLWESYSQRRINQ